MYSRRHEEAAVMLTKLTSDESEGITKSNQDLPHTLTSSERNGSYSMQSTSLTSCTHINAEGSCTHSLQSEASMNPETIHELNLPGPVSTVDHTVSDSIFSEKTGSTRIIVILLSLAFGTLFILFLLYRVN